MVVGDEIASLQKIPEFNETLAEARKFGGCFVLGIQNIPQLVHIYGREMAKAILDLLNTRAYGRSPSAEVPKWWKRSWAISAGARRASRTAMASTRCGTVSPSAGTGQRAHRGLRPDHEDAQLRFYVRLPGEYPVVKLSLKYRKQKKYHPALTERDFRDRLSPELEPHHRKQRAQRAGGHSFPTGDEIAGRGVTALPRPHRLNLRLSHRPPRRQKLTPRDEPGGGRRAGGETVRGTHLPAVPVTAAPDVTAPPASASVSETPPASNVRPFPLRAVPAPVNKAAAEPPPATPPVY